MTTRALLLAAAAALVLSTPAFAQQPAPEQQREDDTPTLTTDDLPAAPVAGQPAGAQTKGEDENLTPEERADAAGTTGDTAAKPDGKKGPSRAELAWRARVAAAERAAAAARQRAQEAELASTELRNQLGSARTVADRNALAAQLEQQGAVVRQAQEDATSAAASLKAIEAEGAANKFSKASGPAATTKSGAPNADFYRARVASAQAELDDANRRVQIYQDRVSDARGRSLGNSGSGDNFAGAKIQDELDAALEELDKARADQEAAQQHLDDATRAARGANVALPRSY